MKADKLKPNLFQRVILVLIAIMAAFGIGLINYAIKIQPDQIWSAATAMFAWLSVIILLVILGVLEEIRKRND